MEDTELKSIVTKRQNTPSSLDKDIGLLLDQERENDHVDLSYFGAVLNRFGFPLSIINCLHNLMAFNKIKININAYFMNEIPKLRGFKQGETISCI